MKNNTIDLADLEQVTGGFGFDGINWSGSAPAKRFVIALPGGNRRVYMNGRDVTNSSISTRP
jgi:hypothetical protein